MVGSDFIAELVPMIKTVAVCDFIGCLSTSEQLISLIYKKGYLYKGIGYCSIPRVVNIGK